MPPAFVDKGNEDMNTITMTDSTRLARFILNAWEARDGRRFQHGIDRAVRLHRAEHPVDVLEAERHEALSAVAAELRAHPKQTGWVSQSARVSACLRLLRHLSVSGS